MSNLDAVQAFVKTDAMDKEPLLRRARIRATLAMRSDYNTGIGTYTELADLVGGTTSDIKQDLEIMQARRIDVGVGSKKKKIWCLPIPMFSDEVYTNSSELVANKLYVLFYQHVLEVIQRKDRVWVKTETNAGSLIGLWIRQLSWGEIEGVVINDSKVLVFCGNEDDAIKVSARFMIRLFDEEQSL